PSVIVEEGEYGRVAYPDTCIGTDSHTTMIDGLGVLGWGVGGIEAEAVMLGQPYYMLVPEVVGVRLHGSLPEGTTATDLVLTVTELLRAHGVVEKLVEFFGPGLAHLPVADRATIANMSPEYGATAGFFPVDDQTLRYLRLTNRGKEADLAEAYYRAQGLFYGTDTREPEYTSIVELDLGSIEPSLAGPRRPQDRVTLSGVEENFFDAFPGDSPEDDRPRGGGIDAPFRNPVVIDIDGEQVEVGDAAVAIAAITSCTNTSNPYVMIGAGLLARNALAKGLQRKPWVKTSLAPGSQVVTRYLDALDLTKDLNELGFNTVGYGCTSCIGNSGPLPAPVAQAIDDHDLTVAGVLSGNRNFEGRIHPQLKANYLASPMLVVGYAIAGRVDVDLVRDPLPSRDRHQTQRVAEKIRQLATVLIARHTEQLAMTFRSLLFIERSRRFDRVRDGRVANRLHPGSLSATRNDSVGVVPAWQERHRRCGGSTRLRFTALSRTPR
ncbi:MAG: hypothetical protein IIA44_15995, partial [Acidobacteria bacterium]|nr:hypothetical protein [Acidobacteriota bacterium]